MKKYSIITFCIAFCSLLTAQVTTLPAFITKGYKGEIIIIYDPAQGNGGMIGATSCYAHTGLITGSSTGISDWQYATATWRGDDSKYKMTSVDGKWQLSIPNIYTYYGCPTTTEILKMAFVFNDGPNGNKEGKTADGSDIFVTLYEAGLNVQFVEPATDKIISTGDSIHFSATASESALLSLSINGSVQTSTTGTTLSYSHTFTTAGDYTCIITAKADTLQNADTLQICVANSPTAASRPSGCTEGINYYANDAAKATLVMYAKDKSGKVADNVFVMGDFNNWTVNNGTQLFKDADNDGYFWITLENLTAGKEYAYQYAVRIGSEMIQISDAYSEKILDPWNDSYLGSIYPNLKAYPDKGDGIVSVLNTRPATFAWSDATLNFTKPDKNNLVIYELWVYDFSPARTIKAVTQRLDYLQKLGINAIELMPVTEFDGNISWGYNPNHFFAADKAYGTENDYKTFIDECHKRGIAVILDMVFNHATGNHPWAKLYWNSTNNKTAANNPWFNVDAPHPYSVFQDFNHAYSGTRNYLNRVLQYWINEYKVDGYRMDLTKGFTNRVCTESTASNYDAERIGYLKGYYDAAKTADANVIFIIEHFCASSEEQELSNYGLLPWNNLNNAFSQTAMGWLRSGDALNGINKKGWISYAESHDEERNFYKAKAYGNGNLKDDEAARINRVPLNVAFSMMLPGSKMMWMFGELGYDYSIEHNGGRTNSKPIPESLGWLSDSTRMNACQRVAATIQLRDTLREMFEKGNCTAKIGSGLSARYIQWTYNEQKMVVVGNFNVSGGSVYTGTAEIAPFHTTGTWYEYFSGTTIDITSTTQNISLQPGELRIYTSQPYSSDSTVKDNTQLRVYPTFTNGIVYISTQGLIPDVQLYDRQGCLIGTWQNESQISLAAYQKGIYFMRLITTDGQRKSVKLIKY